MMMISSSEKGLGTVAGMASTGSRRRRSNSSSSGSSSSSSNGRSGPAGATMPVPPPPLSSCLSPASGETPGLTFPLRGGEKEVREWLGGGGDPGLPFPREQWTPLHAACATGDAASVSLMLDAGAKPGTRGRPSSVLLQHSPLHVAARYGRTGVVRVLLERGAGLSDTDAFGMTPLHFAAFNGHSDVCDLLIANGADPLDESGDGKQSAGITAMEAAEAGIGGVAVAIRMRGEAQKASARRPLLDWLRALGCAQYASSFILAGYDDLSFIAENGGLTAEDLDCIGIPMSKLGARKKLMALHNVSSFLDQHSGEERNSTEDEHDDEEDSGESSGKDSGGERTDDDSQSSTSY